MIELPDVWFGDKNAAETNWRELQTDDLDDDDEDAMTLTTASVLNQVKRTNTMAAEEEKAQTTVNQALNIREFIKKNDI